MENLQILRRNDLKIEDIIDLYNDAGWYHYTEDSDKLIRAINGSMDIFVAMLDNKIVGLVRIIGDGVSILYVQDILVKKEFKRKGIGSLLLKVILEEYKDIRQIVLLTDDSDETRGFYEHNNFISCDKGQLVSFVKFRG